MRSHENFQGAAGDPLFMKSRENVYSLREPLRQEAVLAPIASSCWEITSVVPLKQYGTTPRICGDYHISINEESLNCSCTTNELKDSLKRWIHCQFHSLNLLSNGLRNTSLLTDYFIFIKCWCCEFFLIQWNGNWWMDLLPFLGKKDDLSHLFHEVSLQLKLVIHIQCSMPWPFVELLQVCTNVWLTTDHCALYFKDHYPEIAVLCPEMDNQLWGRQVWYFLCEAILGDPHSGYLDNIKSLER